MQSEISKPLILLVEDSEDDAFFFERTFSRASLQCSLQHVFNGAEAIDFLRNASDSLPQTIFLDLKMPIVNGFEVLEWLQTQHFGAPMQVIVLSGSEHHEDKKRAAALGASGYLVKPIKIADLQLWLGDACSHKIGAAA